MKITKDKISDFFKGRGFYLVLAFCLIATGVAAWTAWAGGRTPDTADNPPTSSSAPSLPDDTTDKVQQEVESEPYSSEDASSEEEALPPPPVVAENFIYPLSGAVLKPFSSNELTYSETFGDLRLHTALDIECEPGTSVNSCGNGIVVAIIDDPLLGKYVEIDHGNEIVARYCGLSDNLSVSEGNIVSAGTKLGLIGDIPSECEDECHLHLEFYKSEMPINPVVIIEG